MPIMLHVEDCRKIPIQELRRLGYLSPHESKSDIYHVPAFDDANKTISILISSDLQATSGTLTIEDTTWQLSTRRLYRQALDGDHDPDDIVEWLVVDNGRRYSSLY